MVNYKITPLTIVVLILFITLSISLLISTSKEYRQRITVINEVNQIEDITNSRNFDQNENEDITNSRNFDQNENEDITNSRNFDHEKVNRKPNITYLKMNKHYTSLKSSFNCSDQHIVLLVLIKSHPKDLNRRKLIRGTWGKNENTLNQNLFRKYFLIGKTIYSEFSQNLEEEISIYKDIVTGEFEDVFYNLPEKAEIGFEWSYKHCSFDYLLETDDDVFVNIPLILFKIENKEFSDTGTYIGNGKINDPVVREAKYGEKYIVSMDDYGGLVYPPYCSGGAYILSQDVIRKILPFIKQHPYKLDDVYIGMLVYNAGVNVEHYQGFNLVAEKCEYDNAEIAHHPADDENCMFKLFHNMISSNAKTDFVKKNYLE